LAARSVATITTIPFTAFSSNESKFFDENGFVLYKDDRPAISEDFAPDYSYLFDAFQSIIKCIPRFSTGLSRT
jgi:hypothetical protein